jgi:taurine dioxygenase
MNGHLDLVCPLVSSSFGGIVKVRNASGSHNLLERAEADPTMLPRMLAECHGLLLLPGMNDMAERPELLLRLSRTFGPEVEDYLQTGAPSKMVHPDVPEILVVSNTPPVERQPPALPDPPLTADGKLPVQYPHRRGWHTDQSFRRPPPDVSLFLAVLPVPQGQGQTLFADGTAAYDALPTTMKDRIEHLDGLHVGSRARRSREAMRLGQTPPTLAPHEYPQRQPIVRPHPETGRKALYLCDHGQMDWFEGPIAGLEPGPDGDGAQLLYELLTHMTQPRFVYAHEWTPGDLVVWDNRCTVHAATWFDANKESRVMWRTTVSGNPGTAYAGETKSWLTAL